MKKNIMMRTASGLLIAVMLTTSIISGTLAKYTTSGQAEDSARVAKFGVAIEATGDADGAFRKTYDKHDTSYSGTLTVKAEEKVVAPGTSGDLGGFGITGKPEVAVRVTYELDTTASKFSNWAVTGDDFYCPIVVTVGTTEISGLDYDNSADFVADINDEVDGFSADYAAGTDLSAEDAPSISWAWAFEGTSTSGQTDAFDTELGDNAVTGTAATITIVMNATVTQID